MAEYEISGGPTPIDFGATGATEILQNIRMILATVAFSCPLDRGFAWNPDVDAPINVVQATQTARIVEAIRKYEPRAQVISVSYQGDLNGVLRPVVKVVIA